MTANEGDHNEGLLAGAREHGEDMRETNEVMARLKDARAYLAAVVAFGPQHGLPSKVELEVEISVLEWVIGEEKI